MAMACLFLACKLEESPRKLKDLAYTFYFLVQRERASSVFILDPHGSILTDIMQTLKEEELKVLAKLAFNVHVQHPHGFLLNILNSLNLTQNKDFVQKAWNFLNDA